MAFIDSPGQEVAYVERWFRRIRAVFADQLVLGRLTTAAAVHLSRGRTCVGVESQRSLHPMTMTCDVAHLART